MLVEVGFTSLNEHLLTVELNEGTVLWNVCDEICRLILIRTYCPLYLLHAYMARSLCLLLII